MFPRKQSTFYTHLRINHSTENALGGTCDICGETFTGAMGLRMHKTQTHNKVAQGTGGDWLRDSDTLWDSDTRWTQTWRGTQTRAGFRHGVGL